MSDVKKIPARSEVDERYTWAIQDIFPTDEAWWEALEKAKGYVDQAKAYKGRLAESGQVLLDFLMLNRKMMEEFNAMANYAQRKWDQDTREPAYQNMVAQLTALMVQLSGSVAFMDPELLAISEMQMKQFYALTPGLEHFRLGIDRKRRKKDHILSEEGENLLAAAGEVSQAPEHIFSMLNDADMVYPDAVDSQGKAHPVTHGTFVPLLQSGDRVLRQSAFESLYSVYKQFRNTSAAVLSSQMKQLQFFAKARKYPSTLHAALFRNEVPVEVYHNLIKTVHENLDKMHRYAALRKRLLKVDELHGYDLYAPMVENMEMKVTFEQAKALTLEALKPLGQEYASILLEGFNNRWIDVYENKGKRSGAYSAGAKVHPFVLLNYSDTLNDAFTLAHEMGHAIHSYLSNKHQSSTYSDYVIFVAEVASTCNEALLMEYLLSETTDKRGRAYLINYFLEQFRTTLYRQTMFAEFELKVNEMAQQGKGITADALCALYGELNQQYFGPEMVVDEGLALEWARIPHFYYNYYVYQYATGYAAAITLSRKILREGAPAVEAYLNFLKGGCSADPITLLKGAGVDMAAPQPITEALNLFGELVDEMERLMA